MSKSRIELIKAYREKVKSANKELTKKELFKDLLNRLYSGEKEIEKIIDAISSGAEATILNIPRKDKIHKGSADTLYNRILIEFENDLKVTLKHAKEQLAGYLLGKFNSGDGYNYTLIASDFITWKVFAPDVKCLDKLDSLREDELILNEVASASFSLTDSNAEDFYYWIDRFLFKEEKQKATLKSIEESFGYQSNTFIECYRKISDVFQDAKKFGEVQVSHEQWKKFLSIAYGSFEGKGNDFVIHTYLSVFAKMLAYSVVSHDDYIDEEEVKGILDGSIFHRYNIQNFVDNDFFHWVKSDRNFKQLKKVFRLIAQEISTFDFENVDEDILKGVYQELIDLDTRHSLGEYYTPDWLCERVVSEYNFKKTDRILDPSCGSGSFLRAALHRLQKLNPHITVEELNNAVYGIDIHPLSVQIAKTTMLLSFGKGIISSKKPIHLNIILANTLLAPEGIQNLFGGEFQLYIDKEKLHLTTQILEDVVLFDEAIDIADELAEDSAGKKKELQKTFENILSKKHKAGGISQQMFESFYQIYEGLKSVKEKGRDSIWKFIIQNLYKPYFLTNKFDYVIGNPPWFTYSSIKNEEYQDILSALSEKYDVKPEKAKNFPHLEIAAIFLSYCSSYFLKPNGKTAFVLPRSFFSADHHDNTRSGVAKGFKLVEAWDLFGVQPLFRVPSCVLFAEKAEEKRNILSTGLKGKCFTGKLPEHNTNWVNAKTLISEESTTFYYIKQGQSSALSKRKAKKSSGINPYKDSFKQGATILPRAFYFIELTQELPPDFDDRILNIKTAEAVQADAKAPWKGIKLSGRIESQFLFRTAISKSILPFCLYNPDLITLPILVEKIDGEDQLELYKADALLKKGFLNAAKWFKNVENIWNINKTEKSKDMTSNGRVDFQRGITDQNLQAKYMVLYNSSAKDANSTIVNREEYDLTFVVDHKAYWMGTNDANEAYYLTAILNSSVPNMLMKDFQTMGLFGARDVHKKILDVYFPKYDSNDPTHQRISELGKLAHGKANEYVLSNPPRELSAIHLGRIRTAIKKHLQMEVKEIDKLVKKILA